MKKPESRAWLSLNRFFLNEYTKFQQEEISNQVAQLVTVFHGHQQQSQAAADDLHPVIVNIRLLKKKKLNLFYTMIRFYKDSQVIPYQRTPVLEFIRKYPRLVFNYFASKRFTTILPISANDETTMMPAAPPLVSIHSIKSVLHPHPEYTFISSSSRCPISNTRKKN